MAQTFRQEVCTYTSLHYQLIMGSRPGTLWHFKHLDGRGRKPYKEYVRGLPRRTSMKGYGMMADGPKSFHLGTKEFSIVLGQISRL